MTAQPVQRREVRYRLRPAPMQMAQQVLAALASERGSTLGALAG